MSAFTILPNYGQEPTLSLITVNNAPKTNWVVDLEIDNYPTGRRWENGKICISSFLMA